MLLGAVRSAALRAGAGRGAAARRSTTAARGGFAGAGRPERDLRRRARRRGWRRACTSRWSAPRTCRGCAPAADRPGADFGDELRARSTSGCARLAARRGAGGVLHAGRGAGAGAAAERRHRPGDAAAPRRARRARARPDGAPRGRRQRRPRRDGHRLHARRGVPLHRRERRRDGAGGRRRLRGGVPRPPAFRPVGPSDAARGRRDDRGRAASPSGSRAGRRRGRHGPRAGTRGAVAGASCTRSRRQLRRARRPHHRPARPNGAGKTTTLRMLAGADRARRRAACGSTASTSARGRAQALARMGVLSDARGLYPRLTARENIVYYGALHGMEREAADARAEELARMLDMTRAARPPHRRLQPGRAHEDGAGARAGARPGQHRPRRADQRPRRAGHARAARERCAGCARPRAAQVHRLLDPHHAGGASGCATASSWSRTAARWPSGTVAELLARRPASATSRRRS